MDESESRPAFKPRRKSKLGVFKNKFVVKPFSQDDEQTAAFAVLRGTDFAFFVRKLNVTFGKGLNRGVDIHLGNCSSITRKHAALMFNPSVRRWELVVLGKSGVLVNSVPFSMGCNPILLDSRDFVTVPCDYCDETHGFYFLLPKNCPDRGLPTNMAEYVMSVPYDKGLKMWTNTERERFQRAFLSLGFHRPAEIKRSAGLSKRTIYEVEEYSKCFLLEIRDQASGDDRTYLDTLIEMENLETAVDGSPRASEESLASWKKIRRSANSWARRIRHLHFLQEIIRLYRLKKRDLLLRIPRSVLAHQPPAEWWTDEDDRNLLIGTHRHGFARYDDIRGDCSLVFSKNSHSSHWPTTDQLTRRVKRLLEAGRASFHFHDDDDDRHDVDDQEQELKMEDEDSDVPVPINLSDSEAPDVSSVLWNKKQTSDFLRSLMIRGIPRNEAGNVRWSCLKNRDSLQSMPDSALVSMYRRFVQESKRIVSQSKKGEASSLKASSDGYLPPGTMSTTVARKFRQRIKLMRMIQKCVTHPRLEHLIRKFAPTSISSTLPIWWSLYDSDSSLLTGIEKHGIGQWSAIFQDPDLRWPVDARDRSFHPRSEPLFKRARALAHAIYRHAVRSNSSLSESFSNDQNDTVSSSGAQFPMRLGDSLEVIVVGKPNPCETSLYPIGYSAIVDQSYCCKDELTREFQFLFKVSDDDQNSSALSIELLDSTNKAPEGPEHDPLCFRGSDLEQLWRQMDQAMHQRLGIQFSETNMSQSVLDIFGLTHPAVLKALEGCSSKTGISNADVPPTPMSDASSHGAMNTSKPFTTRTPAKRALDLTMETDSASQQERSSKKVRH